MITRYGNDLMVLFDESGRILEANDRALATYGYALAELRRLPPGGLRSRTDANAVARDFDLFRQPDGVIYETSHRRKDGSDFPVEVSGRTVELDGQRYRLGIVRDTTERKRAEARLHEQAAVIDEAPIAIIISDLSHRITYCNDGASLLFGLDRTKIVGRTESELFTRGTMRHVAAARTAASASGRWTGEIAVVTKAGRQIHTHFHMSMIRDVAGKPEARLNVVSDITEKKKLEEQFLRAQRLESIGMLAAGIAHDLNNVLAPVGMAATLLRNEVSSSGGRRLLDTLENCATRGASLVRQVVHFTRGMSGEPRLVQVKHLLLDVVGIITETFPKSIVVDEEIANGLWPVTGNPTQIHQVLLNLCVNARDAMPAGGTLRLRAENCMLDLKGAQAIDGGRPGTWLMLQVEDNGTGISAEALPRIWEPFFTTKKTDKGTGLGLSTVRGIVLTHHGFITLQTEPGRGTTFRVYLPAAKSAAAEEVSAATPVAGRGHGELILLVDDEVHIRATARTILETAGYRVITATDGDEAARLFESRAAEFSLVITDRDMPVLDGAGLIRAIRARAPAMKFLGISGLSNSSVHDDDRPQKFAHAFLAKPFSTEKLLNAVEELLRRKSLSN